VIRRIALVLALAGWNPFRTESPDVAAGNRAIADQRWDAALAVYARAAARGDVDADALAYDRAVAEAGKAAASTDDAARAAWREKSLADLKQASRASDPKVRAAADYNRANALMKSGDRELDDAIDAYKQALRADPDMVDARANLEAALGRKRREHPPQQDQPQPGSQGTAPPPQQPGQQPPQQAPNQQPQQPPNQPQSPNPAPQQSPQSSQPGSQSNQPQPGEPPRDSSDSPPQQSNGKPSHERSNPPSPRSPTDRKLDDLEGVSRRLERESARRRASGRADPDHDW
jgi:hypothetical protein